MPRQRFSLTTLLVLLSVAGTAGAEPVSGPDSAKPKRACNVDSFKEYPMREALKRKALPLEMPEIFFKKPGADSATWVPPDEKTRKDALARGLATFSPEERSIMMLAIISHWMNGKDPMIGFFVLPQGIYYDETVKALDEMGLTKHAALFREGRALFGTDYGTREQRYDRWSDGQGGIRDQMLDTHLFVLSKRWAHLPDLLYIATRRIAASPTLSAIHEPLRASTPDDTRLSYLGFGLWNCVDHYGPPDDVSARLKELPDAYRHIVVTFIFQAEMLNGSVEQFFFNSSGGLAPDVVLALRAMRLPKHAAAVQKAIDSFPKPFPRELGKRRAIMSAAGQDFRMALDILTGDVDDGALQLAMIRMARDAGILPK